VTVLVYTPSHVDPAILQGLTVGQGRHNLLDRMVNAVRAEIGRASHQHQLLVGPRGSGKTHTLSVVIDRIRKDKSLNGSVLPLVLPEEEVARQPVDLLLRLLELLAQYLGRADRIVFPQADALAGRLAGDLAQLRAERDHGRAMALAVGAIEHAAATLGRLLLGVVENLDALIGLRGQSEQGWDLRRALQDSKGLMILAAAPSWFGSVEDAEAPFHGFFRVHELPELSPEEMIALMRQRLEVELANPDRDDRRRQRLLCLHAGFDQQAPRLRGLLTYTGGLPRFGHLLFDLAAETDATEVAGLMARFLDEQTPFFQARLDPRMVPGAELEVLDAIARSAGPLTARQLAEAQRGGTANATAVLLKRLRERGLVRESRNDQNREVRFDVAEPLLRVWRRFRIGRSEQEQILSLAEFVAAMFAPEDLRAERSSLAPGSFSFRLLSQAIALHESSRVADSDVVFDGATSALGRQAEEELLHGSLPKAYELQKIVVARLRKNEPSQDLIFALGRLSDIALLAGSLDHAFSAADEGLAIASKVDSDLGRAHCMQSRGDVLFRIGRNLEALAAYDQAEPVYQKVVDDLGRANCIRRRGAVFFQLGRNLEALAAYDQAESVYQKVGDDHGRANCILSRGDVLFQLGRNQEALAAYDQAEPVYQKLGDDLGHAHCMKSRGDVLLRLSRNQEALATYDQAEPAYQKVGDDLGRANCMQSRGVVLFQLGGNQEALAAYDQAEPLYQKVGDDLGRANCIRSRGDVFLRLGRSREALAAYDRAEPLYQKVGDDVGRASCKAGRGRVALSQGDIPIGLQFLAVATLSANSVGHAFNTDLFCSWAINGLAGQVSTQAPGQVREHLATIAPAIHAAGEGEHTRNALVRLVRALLQHLGPEGMLALLPTLEAQLSPERAGFLRPARLAAEILAKRRAPELADEPEEVRRTVREFLAWAKNQPNA
jgi:tetratricopeptide (TPR) repeat protein